MNASISLLMAETTEERPTQQHREYPVGSGPAQLITTTSLTWVITAVVGILKGRRVGCGVIQLTQT